MKFTVRTVLLLVLALAIAAPVSAAEKKKNRKQADPAARMLKRLEKAELDEEQVAKIKKLAAEYAPKLADARNKLGLTREQKKARKAAARQNKTDGVKGKKARQAVNAAMNLSEEQKEANTELSKLQAQFSKAAFAVLSDDQRDQAGIKAKRKKKRKKNRAE